MTSVSFISTRRRWLVAGAIIALVLIALVPWWRNHNYLTDFYDYGLVMSGVGRLARGEHLYVDIVSPIQSGIFLLNGAAGKLGGGGFRAMTYGGAGMIVFLTVATGLILSRRWPVLAMVGIVAGIVCGSVVQHTIIWHNTTGVVCLALAVWGAALAPVLRRSTWPWHILVLVGLWLGGMNKLNFQIVALATVCGWTLRASLTGGEGWGRTFLTLIGWVTAGVVLPVLTEIVWSGASFSTWWYNVVQLPFASRAGTLAQILTWKFHFSSPHIYYGPLVLPQIGLVSMALAFCVIGAGLRRKSPAGWPDRLLLSSAALLALGAGSALHATNFDIGYVSLAATVVLAVGVWLGFDLAPRGLLFWGGLVVPSLLIGAVAWESAWRGQRSQFGHTSASRTAFLPAETADPALDYLRGIRLPPEMHESLAGAARWLHTVERDGLHPVFYGPGAEWFEAVFPAVKPGPMPLLAQWGATYGPRELSRLHEALRSGGAYSSVLSVHAWDAWMPETIRLLDFYFSKSEIGGVIDLRRHSMFSPTLTDTLNFRNQYGGNVASNTLDFCDTPIAPFADAQGRSFLGVKKRAGRISLGVPVHRIESEAMIHRLDRNDATPVYADFRVEMRKDRTWRWHARIELPAGKDDISVPFIADGFSEILDLVVEIPEEFSDRIVAGYRNPSITYAGDGGGPAPYLRPTKLVDEVFDLPPEFAAIFDRPAEVTLRGGRPVPAGFELRAGGELWVRPQGSLAEFSGEIFLAPDSHGSSLPFVRLVWYKTGRLEIIQQERLSDPGGRLQFRAWSAEPDGWFGLLVDPVAGTAPATIRVLKATRSSP